MSEEASRQKEKEYTCKSREDARNRALAWLECRGGAWGGQSTPKMGRREHEGKEVGVTVTDGSHRVIREDFDSKSLPHFNVSVGKGPNSEKAYFTYPLSEKEIKDRQRGIVPKVGYHPRNAPR